MSQHKDCHSGSCGISKSEHSHDSCCKSHETCCCRHGEYEETKCCCCGSYHHAHEGDFAKELLKLADEAWMEVLKEKIKDQIRSKDKQLDQLAKIVAESNKTRWKDKIATKKVCDDFHDQIKDFFQHK